MVSNVARFFVNASQSDKFKQSEVNDGVNDCSYSIFELLFVTNFKVFVALCDAYQPIAGIIHSGSLVIAQWSSVLREQA